MRQWRIHPRETLGRPSSKFVFFSIMSVTANDFTCSCSECADHLRGLVVVTRGAPYPCSPSQISENFRFNCASLSLNLSFPTSSHSEYRCLSRLLRYEYYSGAKTLTRMRSYRVQLKKECSSKFQRGGRSLK